VSGHTQSHRFHTARTDADAQQSLRKSCRDGDHEVHEYSMSATTWGQLVGRAESGSQTEELLENLLVDGFEAIDNDVVGLAYHKLTQVSRWNRKLTRATARPTLPLPRVLFTRNQVDLLKSEQIGRVQCPVLFILCAHVVMSLELRLIAIADRHGRLSLPGIRRLS